MATGSAESTTQADGWVRVGQYAMQRDNWTISKAMVAGVASYRLWDGDVGGAHFKDVQLAKDKAAELDMERATV